jgi:hypothetical protein
MRSRPGASRTFAMFAHAIKRGDHPFRAARKPARRICARRVRRDSALLRWRADRVADGRRCGGWADRVGLVTTRQPRSTSDVAVRRVAYSRPGVSLRSYSRNVRVNDGHRDVKRFELHVCEASSHWCTCRQQDRIATLSRLPNRYRGLQISVWPDVYTAHPVKQVRPKHLAFNQLGQTRVPRGDNPVTRDDEWHGRRPASRTDPGSGAGAELGLGGRGEIGDFVEKQGSSISSVITVLFTSHMRTR